MHPERPLTEDEVLLQCMASHEGTRLAVMPRTIHLLPRAVELYGPRLVEVEFLGVEDAMFVENGHLEILADGAPGLERLTVGNAGMISDGGMRQIGRMANLTHLDLGGARRITNAGLGYLRGLRHLQRVDGTRCRRLAEAGIEALKTYLPLCRIWLSIS